MKRDKGNISFIKIDGIEDFEIVYGADVKNSFPMHIHEKYCIGVLEKGKAILETGNDAYCLESGIIYLINPGEPHLIKPGDTGGFSHIVLCFGAEFHKKYFGETQKFVFSSSVIENKELAREVISFVNQLIRQKHDFDTEFRLLDLLVEMHPFGKFQENEEVLKDYRGNINEVCRYIKSNLSENSSLDELAEVASLSRFHFCRLFKKIVGIPPYDYQIQARVKQARKLLLEKKTAAQIALELGFADQSHFMRFFKKNTGITPQQFVKTNISL